MFRNVQWLAIVASLCCFSMAVEFGCLGGVGAFRTKPINEIIDIPDSANPTDRGKPSDSKPVDDTKPADRATTDTGTPDPGTPDPGTPDPGMPDPVTPDPGTPDPGMPEPRPEPRPEPPVGCQFEFCDDFEAYAGVGLDSQIWRVEKSGKAALDIDTNRAHSGKASLRFRINETSYNNRAFAFLQKWSPRKVYYARAWAYIDRLPKSGHHTTLIETGGTAQRSGVFGGKNFSVVLRYGVQQQERLMANFDTPGFYNNNKGPGSDCWKHSQTKFPANKWICMEWFYDANQKKSRLWVDGQQVLDHDEMFQGCVRGGVDPNKKRVAFPSQFNYFRLSYVTYQGGDNSQHQLWIDDVAIHNQRIGCGK